MVFLIISTIIFIILFTKYYLLHKKNKSLLVSKLKTEEIDQAKIKNLIEEKEILELELGFVKSIYRSKLEKIAMASEKEISKIVKV